MTDADVRERRRFAGIAAAGIAFQGGSAAVDSATIMAALVHQLTGSPIAVGAVTAILRIGWLSPQLVVGFLAQRRASSLRYYAIGGFGRAACLMLLAAVLALGAAFDARADVLAIFVLGLWSAYACLSGIVGVPYNDLVARSVASDRRSRLLAIRFLGGGLLGLVVAAVAHGLTGRLTFPASYAAIIGLASALMFLSAAVFMAMGDPPGQSSPRETGGFTAYLREGLEVYRTDRRFRMYVHAQWFGGAAFMALPFYVVQATDSGLDIGRVALLLGAQTAGSLVSNPLWGWWGDRRGKGRLIEAVALGRIAPPILVLVLAAEGSAPLLLAGFLALFFVLGALANGLTIAVIGFLMEISPDDRRPAYSGYFNALTAPAYLLPLLGGAIASSIGLSGVFAAAAVGAVGQTICLFGIRRVK
jgi:MFS family permease